MCAINGVIFSFFLFYSLNFSPRRGCCDWVFEILHWLLNHKNIMIPPTPHPSKKITFGMTSEGLGDFFAGDFADMCTENMYVDWGSSKTDKR